MKKDSNDHGSLSTDTYSLAGQRQGRNHQPQRPEKKNPLTFKSYAELRDTFRKLADDGELKAVVPVVNQYAQL